MATTAIIKVTEGQLVAGEEYRLALEDMRKRAAALAKVKDVESYGRGLEIVSRGRSDVKQITALYEVERLRLSAPLEELRKQYKALIAEIEAVVGPVERDCSRWRIAEQDAAKREQEKLNKGKRAADRVEVKPNLNSVPGARLVTKYRVEIPNERKLKEWLMRHAAFHEYLWIDFDGIAKRAREQKDPQKTEEEFGGLIKVWKE